MIVADTSGLLAELDYLVVRKLGVVEVELALLDDVTAGAYHLAPIGPGEVAAARSVIERYRDLGIGLTDASIVVLAEQHGTADILTLDHRHFRAMQRGNGEPFRLLPADV